MVAQPVSGYHRSATRDHGFESIRVEGVLPEALRGTLFRNGPALFEHGGRRHNHLFEGDGAVCAVKLGDGAATCAYRLVQSRGLALEREAQKPLFGSAAGWPRRLRNNWKREFKNTANTSVWRWQNRLFALMERGAPTELDPGSMDTIGESDLGGVVTAGFSAHPHRVFQRRADYNFGLVAGRRPHVQLMELPWRGAPRSLGKIELSHYVMMHDFIATANHLVFFIAPVRLQMVRAMLGAADLEKLFEFDRDAGTEIVVVPISRPSDQVRFQVESFWQWHFAGAFEDRDQIIVDFVKYPDFGSLGELDQAERSGRGRLTRAFIEPRSKCLREEALWENPCEYPRVDPRVEGGVHSKVFVSYDSGERVVAKVAVPEARVDSWEFLASEYPSEVVVVPRSRRAAEGDGFAMSLVYDEEADLSHVAVFDTSSFQDGPVARLHLGHHVPMTFHGIWVPEDPATQ